MAAQMNGNGNASKSSAQDFSEGSLNAELLRSLQSRLVQSGEWNRLLRSLDLKLNAAGWDDQVRIHAQEQARSQEQLSLKKLVDDVTPFARSQLRPQRIV